jgi:hypothetical protein
MNQTEEQWSVAIQNLREDLKEHRTESREEFKTLHTDMAEVKDRLTKIETQTATKDSVKKTNWDRILAAAAIVMSVITACILGFK